MKKQKIFIVLGIFVIIIATVAGIFLFRNIHGNINDTVVTNSEEGDITRYQWLEMLCTHAGITEYTSETPYFEDVLPDNKYFPYIQSATEWEILNTGSLFEGEKYASGRFIALTLMKSLGQHKMQIYLDTEKQISDKLYIDLAIESGLIQKSQLTKSFSPNECDNIFKKYSSLHFGEFWLDDVTKVEYQDDVVELPHGSILQHNEDYSQIIVKDSVFSSFGIGQIIVFEQDNTRLKMAKKVAGIDSQGIVSLSEAEIDEVLENLLVSDMQTVSFDDIVNYYRLDDIASSTHVENASINAHFRNISAIPTAKIESEGFKISLSTQSSGEKNYLEISITDNQTGTTYTLPYKKNVKEGNFYFAELDVDKISFASQVKYSVFKGVEYADFAADIHTNLAGGIKTDLSECVDRILLWETPAPLGTGFVGVKLQLYLVISVDGEISIEAEMPIQSSIRYEKGKGIRNFEQKISVEEPTIKAKCEANVSLQPEAMLVILCCLDVLDVEADVGINITAEAKVHPTSQLCIDVSSAYPTFKMSVGQDDESLINFLGFSAEWELVTAENAPFKIGMHYENLPDGTEQFVEECTYTELKDTESDTSVPDISVPDTPVTDPSEGNVISQDGPYTYMTQLGTVNAVTCPTFIFDYPDGWSITIADLNKENNGYADEYVVLSNSRGVNITFTDWSTKHIGGYGNYGAAYIVSKIADASFVATYPAGTDADFSHLGAFMVARIDRTASLDVGASDFTPSDGWSCFAVLPESYIGEHYTYGASGFEEEFWFEYPYPYSFIAKSPNGTFTDDEIQDIIFILSSFRDTEY